MDSDGLDDAAAAVDDGLAAAGAVEVFGDVRGAEDEVLLDDSIVGSNLSGYYSCCGLCTFVCLSDVRKGAAEEK